MQQEQIIRKKQQTKLTQVSGEEKKALRLELIKEHRKKFLRLLPVLSLIQEYFEMRSHYHSIFNLDLNLYKTLVAIILNFGSSFPSFTFMILYYFASLNSKRKERRAGSPK